MCLVQLGPELMALTEQAIESDQYQVAESQAAWAQVAPPPTAASAVGLPLATHIAKLRIPSSARLSDLVT